MTITRINVGRSFSLQADFSPDPREPAFIRGPRQPHKSTGRIVDVGIPRHGVDRRLEQWHGVFDVLRSLALALAYRVGSN